MLVYDRGGIQIYHGDCMEILPSLERGSVDLVLLDTPYGTTQIEWDKAPDLPALWQALAPVCKPTAQTLAFGAQPFTTDLIVSNRGQFRYELIWEKALAMGWLDSNRRPMRAHENILLFSEQGTGAYNPQMRAIPRRNYPRRSCNAGQYSSVQINAGRDNNGEGYPRSVLLFPHDEDRGIHPTAKPLALIKWLIATYSNPGDLVLDPFLGSGTTARACKDLGRGCIGIEARREYVDVTVQRLAQEAMLLEVET